MYMSQYCTPSGEVSRLLKSVIISSQVAQVSASVRPFIFLVTASFLRAIIFFRAGKEPAFDSSLIFCPIFSTFWLISAAAYDNIISLQNH